MLREPKSKSFQILIKERIDPVELQQRLESRLLKGLTKTKGIVNFTSQAKKVLELAIHASDHLESPQVGSEHLLLSIIEEGNNIGAEILTSNPYSLDSNKVRQLILELQRKNTVWSGNKSK